MSENMLETKNLTKKFGSHTTNDSISLHIQKGEIYGLVGRNGAGKTTLMKMISHIYTPSSGEILIQGKPQTPSHHIPIGALIEEPALVPRLSAMENILAKCYLMGVPHPRKHAKELLALVKLDKTGKKDVKNFSLGMRQRAGIALALVGWPEFVLLDEPINGLDPQGIQEIRNIILTLNKEKGITFMISSHLLGELQKVAHRFGIISAGKLVREMGEYDIENMEKADILVRTNDTQQAIKLLSQWKPELIDTGIHIPYEQDEELYQINQTLVNAGVHVEELRINHQSGEDIFLELMGGENYV